MDFLQILEFCAVPHLGRKDKAHIGATEQGNNYLYTQENKSARKLRHTHHKVFNWLLSYLDNT
jgi:hypothetical protein